MAAKTLTAEQKQALAALRKRMGGISEEKRTRLKEQTTIRKAIREALSKGPVTVPELAAAVQYPAEQVFWHLMGMRKYGLVRETGDADPYVRYGLVESEKAAQTPGKKATPGAAAPSAAH